MPDEVSEPDDEDFEYDDEFEGSGYDSAADLAVITVKAEDVFNDTTNEDPWAGVEDYDFF